MGIACGKDGLVVVACLKDVSVYLMSAVLCSKDYDELTKLLR